MHSLSEEPHGYDQAVHRDIHNRLAQVAQIQTIISTVSVCDAH